MARGRTPSRDDKARQQRSAGAKQIILERRGRFVRLALAGAGLALAGSGCDSCKPQVCLEVEASDGGAHPPQRGKGIPPGVCLSVERVPDDPGSETTADPKPCLAPPADRGTNGTADPKPCLAPPVDPRPCLSPMRKPIDDEPDEGREK